MRLRRTRSIECAHPCALDIINSLYLRVHLRQRRPLILLRSHLDCACFECRATPRLSRRTNRSEAQLLSKSLRHWLVTNVCGNHQHPFQYYSMIGRCKDAKNQAESQRRSRTLPANKTLETLVAPAFLQTRGTGPKSWIFRKSLSAGLFG